MTEKKLQPQLRFPGFSGEWEEKRLGEITKINQGLQIPISERLLSPVKDSYFYITNEFIKEGSEKKYYILNPSPSVICNEKDILMTRTGNTGIVLTNLCGVFHNNFFKIQYVSEINRMFLFYFLNLPKTQKIILKYAGASTIPDLNHSDFYRIKIVNPALSEQQKIATFLTTVDKRITLLTQKKEKLEQYKKGVMQKIFNREIRFKDENGNDFPEWEDQFLEELADVVKGQQLNGSELTDIGDYPCLNGGVSPSGYTDKFNTKENTITISEGGNSCGYINFMTTKFWSGGHCYSLLNVVDLIDESFLYHYLKYMQPQIMKLRVGSGLPNIQKKDICKFKVIVPSHPEQQKIASFLSAIDQQIENVGKQINGMKEWKKGLLQQLFV